MTIIISIAIVFLFVIAYLQKQSMETLQGQIDDLKTKLGETSDEENR